VKESERILDRTFDIANEYISKLKFTSTEFEVINGILEKKELEREERRKTYKSLEDIPSSIPVATEYPQQDPISEETENGTINYIFKDGVKCYASFDDMINDIPNVSNKSNKQRDLLEQELAEQEFSEQTLNIPSKEEYEKLNPPHPLIKKTWAMSDKYAKDKRLCYSNNHYHMVVFSVAFNNAMEKALLSKYHIQSKTAYEIAIDIVEGKQYIYGVGNGYPEVVVEEFKKNIKSLPKSFLWHSDGESGWYDIFKVAYHYGQEIDTNVTMSAFEIFIRQDNFVSFWKLYCIIPWLAQEIFLLVTAFTVFGMNPFAMLAWKDELQEWANKNLIHYTILMMIIATLIWTLIFR